MGQWAILAAPAIYCIPGRIIHQARGRQTAMKGVAIPNGCHSKHGSAIELLILLTQYNETAVFLIDYKGENGQ